MPMRFRSRQVKCMLMSRPGRLAHEDGGGQDRHPHAPERAVVDVDDLDAALLEELGALHELLDVVAARRIQLDRDEELAGVEPALEQPWAAPRSRAPEARRSPPGRAGPAPTRAAPRCAGAQRGPAPRAWRGCAAGVVPQQPPTIRAPAAIIRAA